MVYRPRYGAPISWVGLVYVAGALLLFGGADVVARRRDQGADASIRDAAGPVWPGGRFFVAGGAWLVLSTAILLWMDTRPLPEVDVERLFADDRSRAVLAGAGVAAGPEMIEEAGRLLNKDQRGERLLAGVVAFPMTVRPGDEPVPLIFGNGSVIPGEETFGAFHLVSPWKRGGDFRISHVGLSGGLTDGIRPGAEVLVVREPDSVDSVGEFGVVGVRAAAVLPTRWAE